MLHQIILQSPWFCSTEKITTINYLPQCLNSLICYLGWSPQACLFCQKEVKCCSGKNLSPSVLPIMGSASSRPSTPLQRMLNNFISGFSGEYGVRLTKGRLRTLCEVEWPKFGTGWPPAGPLDSKTVQATWEVVTRTSGHPDQFPYIDQWLDLVQNPPPWLQSCAAYNPSSRVLLSQMSPLPKPSFPSHPPVLPTSEEKDSSLLLPPTDNPPPPSPSPPLGSPLSPQLRPVAYHPLNSQLPQILSP
ncbi:Gag polyprotein [Plecturocebus cupreus]